MKKDENESRHIIRSFRHLPGHHCGSTALRNLCHFYGHELSEAMCFGLGSGIGFFYVNGEQMGLKTSPSRLFGGRSLTLETDFFDNLGTPFTWHAGDDFPWAGMREWLDRDVPVLLLCDLKYLSYYNTNTHFSGHVVVLAGYDDTSALLADTHFEALQRASLDELATAMVSNHFPMPVNHHWHEIGPFDLPDLSWAGQRAIVRASRNMLEPHMVIGGISGLRRLAEDLPNWVQAEDLSWCARFGYQVIERRGTGGSNFRRLYAGFLDEMSAYLPALLDLDAVSRTWSIDGQWTELAGVFKEISETGDISLLRTAAGIVESIAEAEQALFRDLRTL